METSIEPFFAARNIAIAGLGLMGGSLAMALHPHCQTLSGLEIDPTTLALAQEMGIFDFLSNRAEEILPRADLIILATPVHSILEYLALIPKICKQNATIIDMGSTKAEIVNAMQALPERFDSLGGHPMCGKEKLSLANADPALFHGANFAFIRLPRTTPETVQFAEQLCQHLQALPLWIDAETHDDWCAGTSHLPFLLASALVQATSPQSFPLVGPGYISASRLAATPASMMLDVLSTNREAILHALGVYKSQIASIEKMLEQEDFAGIENYLNRSNLKRDLLVHDFLERNRP